jgi:hypothetical protein
LGDISNSEAATPQTAWTTNTSGQIEDVADGGKSNRRMAAEPPEKVLDICTAFWQTSSCSSAETARLNPMKARPVPVKHRREKAPRFRSCESNGRRLNLLFATVEVERDNLSRAESLIGCLKIAMEYGGETGAVPYYPDVAQIAGDMVRKSILALDPMNLPGPERGKVREEFVLERIEHRALAEAPLLPPVMRNTFPRKRAQPLHRRDYSKRFFANDASSSACPSTNTSG